MRRPLGFILSTDPDAPNVAILPGNGTIPAGQEGRYAAIATGNAAAITAARTAAAGIIPGVANQTLALGALGLLVLIVAMRGR